MKKKHYRFVKNGTHFWDHQTYDMDCSIASISEVVDYLMRNSFDDLQDGYSKRINRSNIISQFEASHAVSLRKGSV
jgi:hypothetical protein